MTFQPGVPFESGKPSVVVDAGLPAGRYRFQLVVFSERGQRSAPVTVDVIVNPPITRIPLGTPTILRVTPTP